MEPDLSALHEGHRLVTAELMNPFDLVKATDLTDIQIDEYFVDFPSGAGLLERVKPTSRMPMIIFGGKGSGKTHLMRYLTYPLQVRRHGPGQRARAGVTTDGWLGVYFRCGGLNAQRFSGKGQSPEIWEAIFAYYMELWLGQLVIAIIQDLYADAPHLLGPELVRDALHVLDVPPPHSIATLDNLRQHFEHLQRAADRAINNCALTRTLNIEIQATPGRIVFELPKALAKHLPELRSVLFLYLIDELENLTEPQQRYINTLLRERQDPCSFKVGVRLYGLRTTRTLGTGEENRENSEYDVLGLDAELRGRPDDAQLQFAADLVGKRLVQAGYASAGRAGTDSGSPSRWFETAPQDVPSRGNVGARNERDSGAQPVYLTTLRRKLHQGTKASATPGLRSESEIDQVVGLLSYPDDTFVERASVFLLYRAWASRADLIQTAREIAESARRYAKGEEETLHGDVLKHFRSDVIAQLLRDTKQRQRYLGFETFVRMSAGLPRGLLTILKHVFTWSQFFGERPFREGQISVRAQAEGVAQASEWFFNEARAPGPLGGAVRDGMTRLGELLRDLRFSDKPAECSLSTFSADLTTASDRATDVLTEAANWSMLLHIRGGQHDRNRGRVDNKYQVHPMLAPRWDLPISRRGALALSGEDITAIFAPADSAEFDRLRKKRVSGMTAPFFGQGIEEGQGVIPGLADG